MRPIIVPPGGGKEICAFGDTIQFKFGGIESESRITLGMVTTPPGGGPPLHVHRAEDEVFIIESGDIEVNVEGQWQKAVPGSAVFLPRGVPHQYRNAGQVPSRHWVVAAPSGFESFFEKCAAVFSAGGPPDMGRIMQICAEHDCEILGPPAGAHQ